MVAGKSQSEYKKQHTGIRQGCPLSPYLFILVMTIMMFDIRTRLDTPKQREPIQGIKFSDILYADDTLLFGTYSRNISKLLAEIQKESAYYNMKLNLGKCINIAANRKQSTIRFLDETVVPRKSRATYLGAILTDDFNNTAEINNRISDCTNTVNKLKLFWNKANTEISWKLQVFNAIIRSKLLYGLETIQLTNAEKT